jgi:chromosome segregation ATPase
MNIISLYIIAEAEADSHLECDRSGASSKQSSVAAIGASINVSQSNNSSSSTAVNRAADNELRKTLFKKNKEIETLNGECLELEDQVAALKGEVQEAWSSYKGSQEKAAFREAELQDELRMIQKAKSTDKQSLLQQMGRLGEDVDGALKQMRQMQGERDALQTQLRVSLDASAQWERREAALEGQLAEVGKCNYLG